MKNTDVPDCIQHNPLIILGIVNWNMMTNTISLTQRNPHRRGCFYFIAAAITSWVEW